MQRLIITIILSLPLSLTAQFNTIGRIERQKTAQENKISEMKKDTIKTSEERVGEKPDSSQLRFHPPLKGTLTITSPFGTRRNPFDKTKTEFHSGLDLAATLGTPVYAMLPGEVIKTGYDPRAGNYIKLKHGNFTVSYCHLLSRPLPPIGSYVIAGHPIGQVGTSGRSTAPHLHLTIKRNGQVINPAIVLRYFKLV